MSLFSQYLGIAACFSVASALLYVIFGQITVRRLRKSATKDQLGAELVSGWDILNVAMVLALPVGLVRKAARGNLSFLFADADFVLGNTNKLDRILGAVFYWLLVLSSFSILALIFMNEMGFMRD
jgi:hypothetical protein